MTWSFSTEPEFERKLDWMRAFVHDAVLPLETLDIDYRQYREIIAPLQQEVRKQGLWAAHLDPELGGQGFGQVSLALMHEILGASDLAPPVFGVHAPDSGNSELIAIAGTADQKQRWMQPLLDNRLWSAYSMTEQGTGSDPSQFTTSAVQDGQEWVINGAKYCVGNAERSDFHIVMCVTDPDAAPHRRASLVIVPTDTPGIETRALSLMSDPQAIGVVHTHDEVTYTDVHVPLENLLGERGGAFALAQARLGPGRIHHCMRWVGVCRRAFDALCERAVSIYVHGSLLSEKQTIQNWVAESAAAIEAMRLLTLNAAWKIDQVGAKAARLEIAMIKYHGAPVMHDVLDQAIQIHGALGYGGDMPLEQMYRWARASRLYDGPDEVHKMTAARRILSGYEPRDVPSDHVPTRRVAALERYAEQLAALTVH
jgi:acyl-CoA dehydrogenase